MLLNPCQLKEVAGGGWGWGDPSCLKLPGNWLPVKKREFVFVVCFAFVLGVST